MILIRSYLLTQHQSVLTRLVKEVKSIAGGKSDVTRDDLKKMTYLTNILKESKSVSADLHTTFHSIACLFSSATFSIRTRQHSNGPSDYHSSRRWWPRWLLTGPRPSRRECRILYLRNASAGRPLWEGRRGIPSRALGGGFAYVPR